MLQGCSLFQSFREPWALIIDELIKLGYADESVESNVANAKSFDLAFITSPPQHYHLKSFKIQLTFFKDGPGDGETIFSYYLGIQNASLFVAGTMFQGTHYSKVFDSYMNNGSINFQLIKEQLKEIDASIKVANEEFEQAAVKPQIRSIPAMFEGSGPTK